MLVVFIQKELLNIQAKLIQILFIYLNITEKKDYLLMKMSIEDFFNKIQKNINRTKIFYSCPYQKNVKYYYDYINIFFNFNI